MADLNYVYFYNKNVPDKINFISFNFVMFNYTGGQMLRTDDTNNDLSHKNAAACGNEHKCEIQLRSNERMQIFDFHTCWSRHSTKGFEGFGGRC